MSSHNDLSEIDILDMVCDFFATRGYDCRRHALVKENGSFFELDLVCLREQESIAIEIKKIDRIHRNVIREIISRMNVIRGIPSLRRSRIYICIPASSRLLYGARRLLENSGIGLITVNKEGVNIILPARQMDELVMDAFFKDSAFPYFEGLTQEQFQKAISSISGYINTLTKPTYTFRLSRELLDQIDSLSNVSYAELLQDFKTEYEGVSTIREENDVILRTLRKLWAGKYGKTTGAKAFESFSEFEPILKAIPRYRDHMIHSFQVFLMGGLIIDAHYKQLSRLYKMNLRNGKDDSLDFSWLLCSTFHDFCYPIQMYESFNEKFFLDFLQSEVSPVLLQTEKLLLDNDHLKYIDQLVALYTHFEGKSQSSTWTYDSVCRIDATLRSAIIEEVTKKNHAPLSAIALVKKILAEEFVQRDLESYIAGRFSTDIYPAALAIALHDKDMLYKLPEAISLEKIPLAFLLIYCDLVQEFGRSERQNVVELHSFDYKGNIVESTLVFANMQDFKSKTVEMERVFNRTESKTLCFLLNLRHRGSVRSENSCKSPQGYACA